MKATITVDMDNQAFEEDPAMELADILRRLAKDTAKIPWPVTTFRRGLETTIWDTNGNKVGKLKVTP